MPARTSGARAAGPFPGRGLVASSGRALRLGTRTLGTMQSPGQCGTLARGQNGVTVFYNPGISISEPTYNPDTYNPEKNAHPFIIQKKTYNPGIYNPEKVIIQKSCNPEKKPLCAFVATKSCVPQIYNPQFIIQREKYRNH